MVIFVTVVLVFLSIGCLALAIFPDLSQRLIRKRVLAEVAVESRPNLLSQLS